MVALVVVVHITLVPMALVSRGKATLVATARSLAAAVAVKALPVLLHTLIMAVQAVLVRRPLSLVAVSIVAAAAVAVTGAVLRGLAVSVVVAMAA
jgi:hypothetical protein